MYTIKQYKLIIIMTSSHSPSHSQSHHNSDPSLQLMPGCESRCTVLGVVLPGHPHALEGAQGGKDRAADTAAYTHI